MSIPDHFQAVIISDPKDGGKAVGKLATISQDSLPKQGDVLVQVFFSSLNYKDALAITGRPKIVRSFPLVPGVDLAGIVVESTDSRFKRGDPVIATGWGLGERYWGGLAEYACVKADWLLPVPDGLSLLTSMAFGTAGLTAMLSVLALEQAGLTPLTQGGGRDGGVGRGWKFCGRLSPSKRLQGNGDLTQREQPGVFDGTGRRYGDRCLEVRCRIAATAGA
jgi:acrylyl-CoA reductase (NADPH)